MTAPHMGTAGRLGLWRLRHITASTRYVWAAWCAADPESIGMLALLWVPALRSSVKNAAPRPRHERGARRDQVICPSGARGNAPRFIRGHRPASRAARPVARTDRFVVTSQCDLGRPVVFAKILLFSTTPKHF